MIKALVLDVDGMTILRDMYFSVYFSKKHNLAYENILPFFQNEFQQCVIGQADLKKTILPYLPLWGWTGSIDKLLEEWFSYESTLNDALLIDMKERRSQGIHCYLTTNNEQYRTAYIRDVLKLKDRVDGIFSSSALGCKKPEQLFWQKVFEGIYPGITKEEVVVWDDDEENVSSARQFGFHAELFTDISSYKKHIEHYLHTF